MQQSIPFWWQINNRSGKRNRITCRPKNRKYKYPTIKEFPEMDTQSEEGWSEIPPISGRTPPVAERCCKVERVSEAYGLAGIDTELRRRREKGATLHELADYVNERLTAVTLDAAGVELEAEPATVRAAVDGDESVPPDRRDPIREAVAGKLDLQRLQTDFISHETVRMHLKDHLGVSTSSGGFDSTEELRETLLALQAQYLDSIESALGRAADRGFVTGDTFTVYRTRVECDGCSRTYRLEDLLDKGGCDCDSV